MRLRAACGLGLAGWRLILTCSDATTERRSPGPVADDAFDGEAATLTPVSVRIRIALVTAVLLSLASCSATESANPGGELPEINQTVFEQLIADSDRPMVVNLWASWCVPCRSEAPLLTEAHRLLGSEVRFIGIATEDTQPDARAFMDEFGLEFENYFDRNGAVKAWIGTRGLPTTFFVAAGGEVVSTSFGIIDERLLALEIDELRRR